MADVRAINPALADFYEVHMRERQLAQKAAEDARPVSVRVRVGNRVQQSGEGDDPAFLDLVTVSSYMRMLCVYVHYLSVHVCRTVRLDYVRGRFR